MSNEAHTQSTTEKDESEKKPFREIVFEELKFLAGLAVFLLLFFNFVFGHFKIPSESMQPTLEVGDHLYVNKFSYGFSKHSLILGMHKLPFLKEGRVFARKPKRGDVVVFRSPAPGHLIMIKRLIGLPGDKVEVRSGRLFINDKLVPRTLVENLNYREFKTKLVQNVSEYQEALPDTKHPHLIYERSDMDRLDNAGPFIIPPNKYFFMGDNRDNSEDSRAAGGPGFVPFDNFIGKAEMMVFSLNRCKREEDLHCPGFRALKKL